jgi:hypothetical protein
MIHYTLRCSAGHSFDSWFRSSDAFDHLAAAGEVLCAVCADRKVERAIMAPNVVSSRKRAVAPAEPPPAPPAEAPAAAEPTPSQMRQMLREMRRMVEETHTYVGPAFADEARKIHNGEVEHQPIYGEATPAEAEALAEDGIAVARMPWVPLNDA